MEEIVLSLAAIARSAEGSTMSAFWIGLAIDLLSDTIITLEMTR